MSRPHLKSEGKRGYQSDLRAAQTRLTRRAVVDAVLDFLDGIGEIDELPLEREHVG